MKTLMIIASCIALTLVLPGVEKLRCAKIEAREFDMKDKGNLKERLRYYRNFLD